MKESKDQINYPQYIIRIKKNKKWLFEDLHSIRFRTFSTELSLNAQGLWKMSILKVVLQLKPREVWFFQKLASQHLIMDYRKINLLRSNLSNASQLSNFSNISSKKRRKALSIAHNSKNLDIIMSHCQEFEQETKKEKYWKVKTEQYQQMHNQLDDSLRQLFYTQLDIEEENLENIMTEMKFFSKKGRGQQHSLDMYREKHPKRRYPEGTTKENKGMFPQLLQKLQKSKSPSNASKNQSLMMKKGERRKEPEEHIPWAKVKKERQKQFELKRISILSNLMGDNYRKYVKKMNKRKPCIKD